MDNVFDTIATVQVYSVGLRDRTQSKCCSAVVWQCYTCVYRPVAWK